MATLSSLERRILEAVRAITDEGEQATTARVDARLPDVEVPVDQSLEQLKGRGLLQADPGGSADGGSHTLTEAGRAALDEQ